MVKFTGLPADFDEAQLQALLDNRDNEFNDLVSEMTATIHFETIEGKFYHNYADANFQKVLDECADFGESSTGRYGIKAQKCDFATSFKVTPTERKYGKMRESTIINSLYGGRGKLLDQYFMDALCKPVTFCPSQESEGENIVVQDFHVIDPNGEGLTPEKIGMAYDWLDGSQQWGFTPYLLANNLTLAQLRNFDEFKKFDCTYGMGSALWGDLNRFPDYLGINFRKLRNTMKNAGLGTDQKLQKSLVPITPNYLADGTVDTEYEVHWIPMYNRETVAVEPSRELCLKMIEGKTIPGKMKDLLYIDAEFGFGMTKLHTCGVVWIGCLVKKDASCIEWECPDNINLKFPKIVDGKQEE